jgi:tRNA(Ile)-lysidine synthase
LPDPGAPGDAGFRALLARCSFPPAATPVTCAVSGGPDSLALLVLATAASCAVTAVHVDHGVRPGSAAEALVVEAAAARFGAGFRAERVTVAPGPNLEARLRAARYAVLPPDVLTGHTADDQAETVLLHLLRGAGLTGLAGMRPAHRPLLGLRRAETAALCAALGLAPVADPTNDSPAFRRNRIRHELLPLAAAIAQRDVAGLVARTAGIVRDDDDYLESLAAALDPTDARALAAAPAPLARRAVRRWLTPELGGYPPDAAAVERVLAVARGAAPGCDVARDVRVARTAQRLRLEGRSRPGTEAPVTSTAVTGPGAA